MPRLIPRCFAFLLVLNVSACNEPHTETARGSPVEDRSSENVSPPVVTASRVGSDQAPNWYRGSKPWSSITKEGREELMRMHAGYEAYKATANEPGTGSGNAAAAEGKRLIDRIANRYHLDDWYRTPDMFGPRMVIWLPEIAWNDLSAAQRASIEAYMSSKYANWGIGVGRLSGREVLLDRLVVEH